MLRVSFRLFVLSIFMVVSQALISSLARQPIEVEISPHLISDDCTIGLTCAFDDVTWMGSWELTSDNDHFGGFSSLWMSEDATRLITVSDAGYALEAQLKWSEFELLGISVKQFGLIAGLTGSKKNRDVEAIARKSNGNWMLAFESIHRIQSRQSLWRDHNVQTSEIPYKMAKLMPDNGGIEAMVNLNDRQTLLLSEEGRGEKSRHWIGWVADEAGYTPVYYPRYKTFSPTDATKLNDGRMVVLERSFGLVTGLQTRLAWLEMDKDVAPGDVLIVDEIAAFNRRDDLDNAEGIAAFEHDDVHYVMIISDDNFRKQQKTILSLFRLDQ